MLTLVSSGRIKRRLVRVFAALPGLFLLLHSPLDARPQKTVFRSQPVELETEFGRDQRPPAITFAPAWTFSEFHAPLAGDLAASGPALYAASQDGDVAALDPATGKLAWKTRLAEPPAAGPLATEERVFIATRSGHLIALGARDGSVAWSADLGGEPAAAPRLLGGRILLATIGGTLLAIEPRDGSVVARRTLPGRPVTSPEPAPRTILIGIEQGVLLALDAGDLRIRWRRDTGHPITSPPFFYHGRIYVAGGDRMLRCLRFKDGRRRWKARTGAIATARPIGLGPYLYLLCYDDDIYILRARSGHLATRIRLGHRLDANAAVDAEHLFVVPFTEATLVGLALPALQTVGQYALDLRGEWFTTSPLIAADKVALGYGRAEGRVVALAVSRAAPKTANAPGGT